MVTDYGAVALFYDEHPHTAENAWRRALRDIANRYGCEASPHVQATERSDYRKHESLLFDSPFNRLEHAGIFIKREIGANEIVGLAFSMSTTAPQKLGERAAAFEAE
jgi:hypothetical protein